MSGYYWEVRDLNHSWRDWASGRASELEEAQNDATASLFDNDGEFVGPRAYSISIYELNWDQDYRPTPEMLARYNGVPLK